MTTTLRKHEATQRIRDVLQHLPANLVPCLSRGRKLLARVLQYDLAQLPARHALPSPEQAQDLSLDLNNDRGNLGDLCHILELERESMRPAACWDNPWVLSLQKPPC